MRHVKKLLCLVLFLLSACTSVPPVSSDNLIAPDFKAPAQGALIVLLPPTVEAEDLTEGKPILLDQLHRQLKAAGYKVAGLDAANYDTIWAQEVEAVGGVYDAKTGKLRPAQYAQARGQLVQRVSSGTMAALVLQPHLLLRQAQLSGPSARWDGQQRRVQLSNTYGQDYRSDGTTLALSVGLDAYTGSGELVASTYGGVSMLYTVNIQAAKNEVRADLFASDKEMGEGVALALTPVLKPSAQ
jgi:hypothetical protein